MKTVAFYTLGCKVNQYETQAMRELFFDAGYEGGRLYGAGGRVCYQYLFGHEPFRPKIAADDWPRTAHKSRRGHCCGGMLRTDGGGGGWQYRWR